jgi:hypothetical protein
MWRFRSPSVNDLIDISYKLQRIQQISVILYDILKINLYTDWDLSLPMYLQFNNNYILVKKTQPADDNMRDKTRNWLVINRNID